MRFECEGLPWIVGVVLTLLLFLLLVLVLVDDESLAANHHILLQDLLLLFLLLRLLLFLCSTSLFCQQTRHGHLSIQFFTFILHAKQRVSPQKSVHRPIQLTISKFGLIVLHVHTLLQIHLGLHLRLRYL